MMTIRLTNAGNRPAGDGWVGSEPLSSIASSEDRSSLSSWDPHAIPANVDAYNGRRILLLDRRLEKLNERYSILALQGDEAQSFLNFADWVSVPSPSSMGQLLKTSVLSRSQALTVWDRRECSDMDDARWDHFRRTLRRQVVRLIQNSSLLPTSMFLHRDGVRMDRDEHDMVAFFGNGSYADVYAGRMGKDDSVRVVVKVFRSFHNSDSGWSSEQNRIKVRVISEDLSHTSSNFA